MIPDRPRTQSGRQDELTERLERVELRVKQLERTLSAIARDTAGTSVSRPCPNCERGLLLVSDGLIECPICGYTRSL